MSVNWDIAVCLAKLFDELTDGDFLRISSVILWRCAIFGYSTAIGYADGIGVLSYAMCAHLAERSAFVDGSVSVDDVVIAYTVEASLTVPLVDELDCAVLRWSCSCAVDDDLVDGAANESKLCSVENVHDLRSVFACYDDASDCCCHSYDEQHGVLAVHNAHGVRPIF